MPKLALDIVSFAIFENGRASKELSLATGYYGLLPEFTVSELTVGILADVESTLHAGVGGSSTRKRRLSQIGKEVTCPIPIVSQRIY